MVHLRFSEWTGGGKAEFIHEVSRSVYPARGEVLAVGGLDGIELRVDEGCAEQNLMQRSVVKGAKDAVLVVLFIE